MKSVTLLTLCLSLTACANFPLFSDTSWMKNPFADSSPDDTRQRGERITAEPSNPMLWYCYPNEAGLEWQCQHTRNPTRTGGPESATAAEMQVSQTPAAVPDDPPAAMAANAGKSPAMADYQTASTNQHIAPDYTSPPEPPALKEETATRGEPMQPVVHGTSLVADTQKLLELPADFFAVQLIALEDLAELQAFASDKAIMEPLIVRISTASQQRFMVLLEGVYANRQLATEAAEAWILANPDSEKPWVRKLGSLQQAMREAAGNE